MSAETLRRAAALMRKRARAATPSPWIIEAGPRNDNEVLGPWSKKGPRSQAVLTDSAGPEDAKYIASWHPAVALAVADLLDTFAEAIEDGYRLDDLARLEALNVAHAYLGENA